jgi:hypothetical protein
LTPLDTDGLQSDFDKEEFSKFHLLKKHNDSVNQTGLQANVRESALQR